MENEKTQRRISEILENYALQDVAGVRDKIIEMQEQDSEGREARLFVTLHDTL